MKKYARLFRYLAAYKSNIVLYFLFIVLAIVFSIASIGSLPFFIDLIFTKGKADILEPETIANSQDFIRYISFHLQELMKTSGKVYVLALICVMVLIAVFFKNLFTYLSYYILAPMRNGVMNRLRRELFQKILIMPIGYFTEQRKGDIMSRMTNDVGELESSVVGTVEGLIKDPLNLIILLTTLVFISPKLSLFLLIFLPVTGFIIGRISRTLKKQSNAAAIKQGEALSVLDETLSGLWVI